MPVKRGAFSSAILSYFIKLPFVIKIFVLSIFERPFYTGFTVSSRKLDRLVRFGKLEKYLENKCFLFLFNLSHGVQDSVKSFGLCCIGFIRAFHLDTTSVRHF